MSAEDNSSFPPESRDSTEPAPQSPEMPPSVSSEPILGATGPMDLPPGTTWLPPEHFDVPWGWLDVFVVLPLVGLALLITLAVIIVACTVALLHLPTTYVREHFTFIAILAQILTELSLLGFLAWEIRSRSHMPFWRTIGWRPLRPRTGSRAAMIFGFIVGGMVLALLVSLASAAFPPSRPLPIEKIFATRSLTILFIATAVLVAPLVEETLFRGYLYPVAARSFGAVGGIIFTGAVFGLLHGSQLWGGWWQIGLLVMVGILFTFVRASTQTNLTSFLLHISYNGVQVLGVLITLYGPRHTFHMH
jgi:membrane protease YdiL (CAAX protease family)